MDVIKTEMTPKERAVAYAAGEEVDRIPTNLSAGETAPPLYGYRIRDWYFSADIMVDVESHLAEDFGADNMGVGLGLRALVEALGTRLTYPDYGVSYVREPKFSSFGEVEGAELVDIDKDGRLPLIVESFERLMDAYGDVRTLGSGLAGPITTAGQLIDTEVFLRGMIKDRDGVHKLMQYATDNVVKCAHDLHERLGIGLALSEPMASRDLLNRRQFQEFYKPYLDQVVRRMNEFQGSTTIHICGHTRDRWDQVIGSGVSGFWGDNMEDLAELKEAYGDRVAITGNVPPVDVLLNGTVDDIDASVRSCIAKTADSPCGFTLCPGCTTPVGTSREHLVAFMNAAATYGRGARRGHMARGIIEGDGPLAAEGR